PCPSPAPDGAKHAYYTIPDADPPIVLTDRVAGDPVVMVTGAWTYSSSPLSTASTTAVACSDPPRYRPKLFVSDADAVPPTGPVNPTIQVTSHVPAGIVVEHSVVPPDGWVCDPDAPSHVPAPAPGFVHLRPRLIAAFTDSSGCEVGHMSVYAAT